MPTDSTVNRLIPHLRRVAMKADNATSDGQLLSAFATNRDEAAFATLVRRHGPMVLGVCRRVVGDTHLAEDAFQATFLVLARRAAVVQPRNLVGPWLYGVAYRTAMKARSTVARRYAKEKQVDALPQLPANAEDAWTDLQPVLDAELARLPDKFRIPILLCDLAGRPQRDVAKQLNLPVTTLTNRLTAGRRLLAKRLSDRGITLSTAAIASALGWHAATSAVSAQLSAATVKSAVAVAAGAAVGVPLPITELCDGVMRMFVLAKMKTASIGILTCVAVVAGLALAANPTLQANPPEKPSDTSAAKAKEPKQHGGIDDLTYLRRMSLDLRGILPTVLEAHYFVADRDTNKRAKVVEWMLADHGKQKVTAACQACHVGVADADLFKERAQSAWLRFHGDHSAFEDDMQLRAWYQVFDPKPDEIKVAAEYEKAVADYQAAQAHLSAVKRKYEVESAATKALIDQAKEKLAQSETVVRKIEKSDMETKSRNAVLRNFTTPNQPDTQLLRYYRMKSARTNEDADYLRQVVKDLTGVPPTTVELNYFNDDKDAKKREKVLELLRAKGNTTDADIAKFLKDPEVSKRWAEYQAKVAADRAKVYERYRDLSRAAANDDSLSRLLGSMIDAKKSDAQILEATFLAAMARFPTETEKKVILNGLKDQPDRAAAWQIVVKSLSATNEAKAHADALANRAGK